MPKPRKQLQKRAPIHFVFKAHTDDEPYLSQAYLQGTRTHVYEAFSGALSPLTRKDFPWLESNSRYDRSRNRLFSKATRKGITVVAGELVNLPEMLKLAFLEENTRKAETRVMEAWTALSSLPNNKAIIFINTRLLPRFKRFVAAFASAVRERNRIIRRTLVKRKQKGPVVARFGTGHSTLSSELQRSKKKGGEGMQTTREMPSQVFLDVPVRKILAGKVPTRLDYKRAIITALFPQPRTDAQHREIALIGMTLLSTLTEPQLDRILQTRNLGLMFEFNFHGTRIPSHDEMEVFLNAHSSFYRRQKAIEEMKRRQRQTGTGGMH